MVGGGIVILVGVGGMYFEVKIIFIVIMLCIMVVIGGFMFGYDVGVLGLFVNFFMKMFFGIIVEVEELCWSYVNMLF